LVKIILMVKIEARLILLILFQPHANSFVSGDLSYTSGQWSDTVRYFEKALLEYFEAEENCRLDCEKPFEMGWYPDFVTSVASNAFFDSLNVCILGGYACVCLPYRI